MSTKTPTHKPATQLDTGDVIRYAGLTLKIVAVHNRKGYGTGVAPSPYSQHVGTDSELHSFALDLNSGGRTYIGFARNAMVELA